MYEDNDFIAFLYQVPGFIFLKFHLNARIIKAHRGNAIKFWKILAVIDNQNRFSSTKLKPNGLNIAINELSKGFLIKGSQV